MGMYWWCFFVRWSNLFCTSWSCARLQAASRTTCFYRLVDCLLCCSHQKCSTRSPTPHPRPSPSCPLSSCTSSSSYPPAPQPPPIQQAHPPGRISQAGLPRSRSLRVILRVIPWAADPWVAPIIINWIKQDIMSIYSIIARSENAGCGTAWRPYRIPFWISCRKDLSKNARETPPHSPLLAPSSWLLGNSQSTVFLLGLDL